MENKKIQSYPPLKHWISRKDFEEQWSLALGSPVTLEQRTKEHPNQENTKEIIFLRKKKDVPEKKTIEKPKLEQSLKDAYLKTTFVVFNSPIKIRIGEVNAELNELLKQKNCVSWAFITPWNPKSENLSHGENYIRLQELIQMICPLEYFEGEGIGEDKSWLPERSLLILGISRQKAEEIGIHFKQNAIVFGNLNSVAQLIDLTQKI